MEQRAIYPKMSPVHERKRKKVSRNFWRALHTTPTGHFASVFLRATLLSLILLSLQTPGEGLHFCFDGTKEGRFCKDYRTV